MIIFRKGSDSWLYQVSFDVHVDFCIWVLETDGLRVPPFDHHNEGNQMLQAAGLDGNNWQAWMQSMTSTHDRRLYNRHLQMAHEGKELFRKELEERSSEGDIHEEPLNQFFKETLLTSTSRPYFPPDFWQEYVDVGKRLNEIWEHYLRMPTRNPWPEKSKSSPPFWNLWQDLEPYHTRLDALIIHLVAYPKQIDYLLPPFSAIMTVVDGHLDFESFRVRIVQAAEALATSTSS